MYGRPWQLDGLDMRNYLPTHVTPTQGPNHNINKPTRILMSAILLRPKRGENLLVKCLKCGGEVVGPAKEWDMHPKDGRGPALHIKHFSCPSCGKKFRLATKLPLVGA